MVKKKTIKALSFTYSIPGTASSYLTTLKTTDTIKTHAHTIIYTIDQYNYSASIFPLSRNHQFIVNTP